MKLDPLYKELNLKFKEDKKLNIINTIGFEIYEDLIKQLDKYVINLKLPKSDEELSNLGPKLKALSNLLGSISLASYLDQSCGHQEKEEFKTLKDSLLKIETVYGKFISDLSFHIKEFNTDNSERFLKRMKFLSKYTPENENTRSIISKLEETLEKQAELYQVIEDSIDYGEFEGKKVNKFDLAPLLHNPDKDVRTRAYRHFIQKRVIADESLYLLQAAMSSTKNQISKLYGFKNSHDSECKISLNIDEKVIYELKDLFKQFIPLKKRLSEVRRKLLKLNKLGSEDGYAPIFNSHDIKFEDAINLIDKHLITPINNQYSEYRSLIEPLIKKMDVKLENDPKRMQGAWFGGLDNNEELSGVMFFGKYHGKIDDVRTMAHELNHGVHHFLNAKDGEINDTGTPAFMTEAMAMSAENIFLNNWINSNDASKEEKIELLLGKLENSFAAIFGQYLVHMIELGFYDGKINDYDSYKNYSKKLIEELKTPGIETHEDIYKVHMLRTHHYNHTLYCIRYVLAELIATKLETMNYKDIASLAEETSKQITTEEIYSVYKKYDIDLSNTNWIKDAFTKYEEYLVKLEKLIG